MNEILIPKLNESLIFPDPQTDEGLLAWGGDLSVKRLLEAYKNGIFPWFNKNEPLLWWSPNPRCVLYLNDLKISKSLKKSMKKFYVTFDEDFLGVITNCAKTRTQKNEPTWIDERIIKAYHNLHIKGYAKSVEVWQNGELVGGLYGVVMGKIFCGESMFSKISDASKIALVHLVETLKKQDFKLIDCQVPNPHLLSLGAKCISREEFLKALKIKNS